MQNYFLITVEVLASCLLGMMAGFFFAFAVDVAPAMTNLDASGYVSTQQSINRVVRNALFGAVYFGSALLPLLVSAAMLWARSWRKAMGWLVIAIVYGGAVFWLTRTVNVPINNELATWSPSSPPDTWQQARDTWNAANLTRTLAATACFVAALCLLALPMRPQPRGESY